MSYQQLILCFLSHYLPRVPLKDVFQADAFSHFRTYTYFILFGRYVLSVGVQVVGGSDYWSGVENAIFILLTVRPPTPFPEVSYSHLPYKQMT